MWWDSFWLRFQVWTSGIGVNVSGFVDVGPVLLLLHRAAGRRRQAAFGSVTTDQQRDRWGWTIHHFGLRSLLILWECSPKSIAAERTIPKGCSETLVVCVSRSYICCHLESVGAKTGALGGVQSGRIPIAAPGPGHFPLETPCTGLRPQASVDLGSSHHETGTQLMKVCLVLGSLSMRGVKEQPCDIVPAHISSNVSLNLFCVFCRIFCLSYKWCASVQRLFILRFCQLEYLLGRPKNCSLNLKIPLRLSRLLEQRGSDRVRMPAYLQPRRSWEMEPDLPLPQLPGSRAQLGLS